MPVRSVNVRVAPVELLNTALLVRLVVPPTDIVPALVRPPATSQPVTVIVPEFVSVPPAVKIVPIKSDVPATVNTARTFSDPSVLFNVPAIVPLVPTSRVPVLVISSVV